MNQYSAAYYGYLWAEVTVRMYNMIIAKLTYNHDIYIYIYTYI